jgi:molecular chaperone DnaK
VEQGAKLTDQERRTIEQALDDARDALRGDDVERIRRAQDSLMQAGRTLAEAASRQPSAAGASSAPREGEVVDAEFAEVDDEKG